MNTKLNQHNASNQLKAGLSSQNQPLFDTLKLKPADQVQYYKSSSLVSNIENDDCIAVGGSAVWSDKLDIFLEADYGAEQIQSFYESVQKSLVANQQNPKFIEFLDQAYAKLGFGIDPELFAHLMQYSASFGKKFPDSQAVDFEQQMRRSQYYSPSSAPKLSAMIAQKLMMCAENCTLARKYLKDQGYDFYLLNGGVLGDFQAEGENFSEAHSFLLFEKEGKEWIFDPTHSQKRNDFYYPRIIKIPDGISFLELFKKKECFFVQGQGSKVYYGNGMNDYVLEKELISPSQE